MDILLNGEPCQAEFNITTDPSISLEHLIFDPPWGLKITTEVICKRDGVAFQRFVIAETLGESLPAVFTTP